MKARKPRKVEQTLIDAAGKGEAAESEAIDKVAELHPSVDELVELLEHRTREVNRLAARCLLALPYGRKVEDLHPVMRKVTQFRRHYKNEKKRQVGGFFKKWLFCSLLVFAAAAVYTICDHAFRPPVAAGPSLYEWVGILLLIAIIGGFRFSVPEDYIWVPPGYRPDSTPDNKVSFGLAAINRLLALAVDKESGIQKDAIAALDPVLPLLRPSDSSLIRPESKLAMARAAQAREDEDISDKFRLKLVGALSLIGDSDSLPALRRIASSRAEEEVIRGAAKEAIAAIERRADEERRMGLLLHPAMSPDSSVLLRPAVGSPGESETLLHIPSDR